MLRRLSAVLLSGAIAMVPATLTAQARLSIAAGVSAPVRDLGEATDLGYNAAAGINFGGTRLPIGVRLEGAYNGFEYKNDLGNVRVISGTVNGVVNFSQAADSPYLIGGLGAYNTKFDIESLPDPDSDTSLGINIGGGLRFPLSGLSTFLEARYHAVFRDDDGGSNFQFIPITFGIMF